MEMIYTLPVFGLLLLIEFLYGYFKKKNTYHDIKDTIASLSLGLSQVLVTVIFSSVLLIINTFLYKHSLFELGSSWIEIILLFLIMDFSFYWWHRASHRMRFLWANHVNHHSSTEFNFSTALRQPVFSPVLRPLFYFYIPWLGFHPKLMISISIVSLIWAVWTHTKHVGKLGLLEYIIVTPSSHRVHHGTNKKYIDKNYGGIFIFWDIIFGTFQKEEEQVIFGITNNINTYNPLKIIFHEWKSWLIDIKNSKSLRDAFIHTFHPPK